MHELYAKKYDVFKRGGNALPRFERYGPSECLKLFEHVKMKYAQKILSNSSLYSQFYRQCYHETGRLPRATPEELERDYLKFYKQLPYSLTEGLMMEEAANPGSVKALPVPVEDSKTEEQKDSLEQQDSNKQKTASKEEEKEEEKERTLLKTSRRKMKRKLRPMEVFEQQLARDLDFNLCYSYMVSETSLGIRFFWKGNIQLASHPNYWQAPYF